MSDTHIMVGRPSVFASGAVPEGSTIEQAMQAANLLNWNVRTAPMFVHVPGAEGGTQVRAPFKQGIVRDNPYDTGRIDVLGDAGKSYKASQNEELAALMQDVVDNSAAQPEAALSINGGRRVLLQLRLGTDILVGGDATQAYLVGSQAHTGSESMKLFVMGQRMACANMFAPALRGAKSVYRIRHTEQSDRRIAEIRATLDLSFAYFEDLGAAIARMANETYTDAQFRALVRREFGARKGATEREQRNAEARQAEFIGLWNGSQTLTGIKGTRWGAYNVFTEWADHFSRVNAKGKDKELVRAEKVLSGGFDVMKQTMWNKLYVPA